MHGKVYSDEGSTVHEMAPSAARRQGQVYFVQSPEDGEVEKISTESGFSPAGSPVRQNPRSSAGYSALSLYQGRRVWEYESFEDGEWRSPREQRTRKVRLYLCLVLAFALAFGLFCLSIWGASQFFKPKITMQGIVYESLSVQAGSDESGVNTDMLNLNSTVKISYRNPSTFFTVHVTSSPVELSHFLLTLASGQIEEFSQVRQSDRVIETVVEGRQVALYGSIPVLYKQRTRPERVYLPLNLTFTLTSRAYVLGRLVSSTFHSHIRCSLYFHGDRLNKNINISKYCSNRP